MGMRFIRAKWSTNCERVALALAYKGIETESVWINYADRSLVEEVSGQSLVPVIDDGGTVLHDSTAILEHLDATNPEPELFPSDVQHRDEVEAFVLWFNDTWKSWANGIEGELALLAARTGGVEQAAATVALDPDGLDALLGQLTGEQQLLVEEYATQLDAALDRVETMLAGRADPYLVGNQLTAADLVAFPFIKYALIRDPADTELFHLLLDRFQTAEGRPALAAWITRINALPRV